MSDILPDREAKALVALDQAKRAIEEARNNTDVEALMQYRDQAAAVAHYVRRRNESRAIADDAGEVKIRAEAAIGQLDNRPVGRVSKSTPTVDLPPIEVAPTTRAAIRKLGELKPEQLDDVVEQLRADESGGVTTSRAATLARKILPKPKPRKPKPKKPEPVLEDYLHDMLPGAEPMGAFRQTILAWCKQEREIDGALDAVGMKLVPKSEEDRVALLDGLACIRRTATRLEGQLQNG